MEQAGIVFMFIPFFAAAMPRVMARGITFS